MSTKVDGGGGGFSEWNGPFLAVLIHALERQVFVKWKVAVQYTTLNFNISRTWVFKWLGEMALFGLK